MIPADREELHVLAGEYVLGVLEREAAREVEAALATNGELGRAVALWEERLHGLAALAPSAEPPARLWDAIAARLGPSRAGPAATGLWNSLALWRWSTAAAGAVAACLALYLALAPPAAGPSFVAILRAPQQEQPAWVATAGRNGLLVRAVARGTADRGAADRGTAPSAHAFELWVIPPGTTRPQSLGVIPPDGRLELGVLPAALREGGTLAISIEPAGGSPTGQPTGPVVFTGTLVAAK